METLDVYFAQHGLAVDKAENAERPLSQEGKNQTETIAQQLLISKIQIDRVCHSGKLRAAQTAEIITRCLNILSINEIEGLSPNDDIQRLIPRLQHKTLYVGHLPHLEKLCSYLLTGEKSNSIIHFQNSGIIKLSLNEQHQQLHWYLTPGTITRTDIT